MTKCSAENLIVTADAHNWIHTSAAPDYGYDAAGNMTSDPTDGVSMSYDPENRIATATKNGISTTYTYDADGNRVKKTSGSTATLYALGGSRATVLWASGQTRKLSSSGEFVDQHWASQSACGLAFVSARGLGSG